MMTNLLSWLKLSFICLFISSFAFTSYAAPYEEEIEDEEDEIDTLTVRYAHQMESILRRDSINYHFEYKELTPIRKFDPDYTHKEVYTTAEKVELINILIVVKDYLYDELGIYCNQYADDILRYAGYTSTIEIVHLDTYSQVKELIHS